MSNTFFVTGTDTEVGKTVVSAGLLQAANNQGLSSYGLKPVAAGAYEQDGVLRNEDADLLIKYSSVSLPYSQVNPFVLKAPKAPHLAALDEGRSLSLSRIEGICRGTLMNKADFKIIEGVGGWRTPLNQREMMSDLPQRLSLPIILVVGIRLGCLNHALLTMEAINNDRLTLAGWVANIVDPNMLSVAENIQSLQALMTAPLLGVVQWQKPLNIINIAKDLDLPSQI